MFLLSDDSWEIKTTAKKGKGVFATKDIAAGQIIGDYIGKVIRTAEEDTTEGDEGLYLMYYHDFASLYPTDIKAPGIHLLNHSCTPNCWMYTYKGHTLFFALRRIFKGEEFTVSYLLSPIDDCNPCTHQCHCGSPLCIETMHLSHERFDRWNAFNEAQIKETKRARVRYGKVLPMLVSYPKTIIDRPIYDLFGSFEEPAFVLDDAIIPSVKKLRAILRKTGKIIALSKQKKKILGIQNNTIIWKKN